MDKLQWTHGARPNSLYRGEFVCPRDCLCLEPSPAFVEPTPEPRAKHVHVTTETTAPHNDRKWRYPEKFTELLAKYQPLLDKIAEKRPTRDYAGKTVDTRRGDTAWQADPPWLSAKLCFTLSHRYDVKHAASDREPALYDDDTRSRGPLTVEELLEKNQSLLDTMETKKRQNLEITDAPEPSTNDHGEQPRQGASDDSCWWELDTTLLEPKHLAEHRATVATALACHYKDYMLKDDKQDTAMQIKSGNTNLKYDILRRLSGVRECPDLHFDQLYNLEAVEVGILPPYLHATDRHTRHYLNPMSAVPPWFLELLLSGSVTLSLHPTFPVKLADAGEDPAIIHEYEQLRKAEFSLTISPRGHIMPFCRPSECKLRVRERVRFTGDNSISAPGSRQYYLQTIPRMKRNECHPAADCKSHWRREYNCIFSGSEAFKRNRVAFCGSYTKSP